MKELEYPFDSSLVLSKYKRLKRTLLEDGATRIKKKVAVLGGSTTHDIIRSMELFLLNYGIEPEFYESEYGQYWQDAMFPGPELSEFKPDIVYIHTSIRNITNAPDISDTTESASAKLDSEYEHFKVMWDKLYSLYDCPIIQDNFEYPSWRLLGNRDSYDHRGMVNFVSKLNLKFAEYAENHESFYISDVNYLSSCYGLDKWADTLYWHMYKYSLCFDAIPYLGFNVANIIKSIYGKNKKSLVLDMDNTLWGGIIGDDGVEGIEIGQETNLGQVYAEFQSYVKKQKDIGVILNVASKNEEENALAGLEHPDSILKKDDFIYIKANWEPKSENIKAIAQGMNILPDSMVFIDDNPMERDIVYTQVPGVQTPDIGKPENYIKVIDHAGFFEVTNLSEDDKKRSEMYKANLQREQAQNSFADYGEYLKSLDMHAVIKPFEELYYPRISQLTNKSNQFNLTTKRYTQDDIAKAATDTNNITLYGRLEDKFGDNGIVSLLVGHKDGNALHMDLWLMSCRVLKRDMEYAMMDSLVAECKKQGICEIYGYYYPTAKNKMVENFYGLQGFEKIAEDDGNTTWKFVITDDYVNKNNAIEVENNQ
ncbi:MAG: HAD-IIIC family phosphatase [Butyrivibrio sp.]|jgi:FkbH-like protein|nr:HAD-IIIC family phosphatase [Butyrivibrio sp.]